MKQRLYNYLYIIYIYKYILYIDNLLDGLDETK
jgi:hypothetical protein